MKRRKDDNFMGMGGKLKVVFIPPSQLEQILKGQADTAAGAYDVSNLIASLAIEFWRLESRLQKDKAISATENTNFNSALDQMQRIKDIFKKHEIETRDHTGEKYDDGMSVKALHFEESNSMPEGQMRIIETIKPSVYFKGSVIFHGEVIVAKGTKKTEGGNNGS